MIDYNDPDDPNYDPYWGDKETGHSGPADFPDLSGFELLELEEGYIQQMRKEGLLRPTLVKPGENKPQSETKSLVNPPDDDISF